MKVTRNNKGENNPMYGKNHSEETRKRMSKSHLGHTLSEETKGKISKVLKGRNTWQLGRKASSETKKKMSKSSLG